MDRFDKFTDRARKVLTLAQDEAQRFNHNYIGTEHLLLGLVREGEGVAARVLENMNVELPKVGAIARLWAKWASRLAPSVSSSLR
jgi:ATP-dependent Clp protease ATP-binding subunit ClpC